MKRDYFLVFACVALAIFYVVSVVIINNSLDIRVRKAEAAAYQQGWKDALYKRPTSDELEYVCAGLWARDETIKYQARSGQ